MRGEHLRLTFGHLRERTRRPAAGPDIEGIRNAMPVSTSGSFTPPGGGNSSAGAPAPTEASNSDSCVVSLTAHRPFALLKG